MYVRTPGVWAITCLLTYVRTPGLWGHHLRTYVLYVRTPGLWAAPPPEAGLLPKLLRHALLGLCATCVSDCTSNSIRVIKTTRQTAEVLYLHSISIVRSW